MECLLGIKCDDFVMIAGDKTNAHSIVVMKTDEKKLHKLSNKLVMAVSGEQGDTSQFSEYIAKNIQLYKMRNGYELGAKSAANFTRRNLADALRSQGPYHVNLLLAGYDNHDGPQLFFVDYLASMTDLQYASHGYGGLFSLSVMDRYYKNNLTREEAYALLQKCVAEVQKRLIINLPNFMVQVIDKNGIQDLEPITVQSIIASQHIKLQ